MPCDSDGLADPYVRAYLLPERAKSSKRRTDVAKNTLAPAYEERLVSIQIYAFSWQTMEYTLVTCIFS